MPPTRLAPSYTSHWIELPAVLDPLGHKQRADWIWEAAGEVLRELVNHKVLQAEPVREECTCTKDAFGSCLLHQVAWGK